MSREIAEIRNEVKAWPLVLREDQRITYRSPSNIALLKYWGKRPGQLPVNPSLSFSLTKAFTETTLIAVQNAPQKGLYDLNEDPDHPFLIKIRPFWEKVQQEIPLLTGLRISILTQNSFPHGAGIASSASGFSALALAILDLAQTLSKRQLARAEFLKYASNLARMGSGSAARSIYPGFTVWGATPVYTGSSDLFASDINHQIHPDFTHLQNAILLVSAREKSLSSSGGHALMNSHPYAEGRILQAQNHLLQFHNALTEGDLQKLAVLSEAEALSLHALIMSSAGGTILLEPSSLALIQRIRSARKSGLPVFFTIDAGPNIHLIYPESTKDAVRDFIRNGLSDLCPENQVIYDSCGPGPEKLTELP